MTLAITPLYALPLAILYVALTLRVVRLRRKHKVGIGDGGQRDLAKAIRAHANAGETIPLALVLMLLCELTGASAGLLHGGGAVLVAGRVIHAFGLSRHSGYSKGRFFGMILTIIAIVVFAVTAVF